MSLEGKKILLGVCGSIAAYKTPELVRQLTKNGAEVKVVCTPEALQFVSALSLSTVSKNPVAHDLSNDSQWENHVKLGRWADLFLIAPTSANTIAKMANGLCDNLLLAIYLAARSPIAIAPAMDEDMYLHPSTTKNLQTLSSYPEHHILPVDEGELASGIVGKGRMMQPQAICEWVVDFLEQKKKLSNKHFLITAGPTYEPIDPVRFIGNHSTGKMGIALSESAAKMGARVTLVLGPSQYRPDGRYSIDVIEVDTADQMLDASMSRSDADAIICSAAVADYKPKEVATQKIKKKTEELDIELTKNPDILSTLGHQKSNGQYIVGFALETQNEVENARTKLKKKNADMIILNSLQDQGAGFGHDTNKVTIITADDAETLDLMPKKELADIIISRVAGHIT